jgi:hypothetical protein
MERREAGIWEEKKGQWRERGADNAVPSMDAGERETTTLTAL